MNTDRLKTSLRLLQWTVCLVVIWESVRFIASDSTSRALAHMHLPVWIAPVLGGTEILAALLFLLPKTLRVGAYALLAIFAIAALLHILHRQYDVAVLLVYAAAVWASMQSTEGMSV
jgi:hypothetical protein